LPLARWGLIYFPPHKLCILGAGKDEHGKHRHRERPTSALKQQDYPPADFATLN
jgi:hypothetical protein